MKPSYEVVHNVWDFAVSHKIYDINTLKASYKTSNKNLGLKWSLASKHNGTFKVSVCFFCNYILLLLEQTTSLPLLCDLSIFRIILLRFISIIKILLSKDIIVIKTSIYYTIIATRKVVSALRPKTL